MLSKGHKMKDTKENRYASYHRDPDVPPTQQKNELAPQCCDCPHTLGTGKNLRCIYIIYPKQRKFPCYFKEHVQRGGFDGIYGASVLSKIRNTTTDPIQILPNLTPEQAKNFQYLGYGILHLHCVRGNMIQITEEQARSCEVTVFFSKQLKKQKVYFAVSTAIRFFKCFINADGDRVCATWTISEQYLSDVNIDNLVISKVKGLITNPFEDYKFLEYGYVLNNKRVILKTGDT